MQTLLVHAEVIKAIEGTLVRRGIDAQELPDAVAEVHRRALEAATRGHAPLEVAALRALCTRIARDYAIDTARCHKARSLYNLGPCEDPDEHADERTLSWGQDPVDEKRMVDILRGQITNGEMPEHAVPILEAEAEGVARGVVAEELGLTAWTVEGRLRAMRKRFRARLAELGVGG